MTEHENLPTKLAAQGLTATTEKRGSLVARGLMALRKDNVALYRQVRAVFDRRDITSGWDAADNPAISSAFKIFQQLADQNFGKAYYPLSILYGGKRDFEEEGQDRAQHFAQLAFDWCFANQANQDVELWCDLGKMYRLGHGIEQNDEQAVCWFTKAAEQGDEEGQFNLGTMYEDGRGVGQDDEQAVYWYRKAAEQGSEEGQFNAERLQVNAERLLNEYHNLGRLCYDRRNYEQAMYWYRKAAEHGHFLSQLFLAEMYEDGRGIQDDKQAVFWFHKALETAQGSSLDAKNGLKRLGIDWEKT